MDLGPLTRTARLALASALTTGAAFAQTLGDSTPIDLPVTRVVLFTTGVGYFEHEGTVTGNQALALEVPQDAMDDLLQSLVLVDLDGGTVRPVRYTAQDPLQRVLSGYPIDVSSNLTLEGVLGQARGAVVTLVGSHTVTGAVSGVERVQAPEQAPRTFVTLVTSDGLVRAPLDEYDEVRFADEKLKAQLDAALAAIAAHAGEDTSKVTIEFSGEGTRRVRVAYLREMPVWKSTYRLLVGEDGRGTLQGWAIFDNPTNLRLEDVRVSFVAGQPISFITSLFEPIYVERPRVETELAGNVVAKLDDGASFPAMFSRAAAPSPTAAGAMAETYLADAGVTAMASGTQGGSSFSYDVVQPVTVGPHESAMVPIVVTEVSAARSSVYNEETLADRPLHAVRLTNDTGLHLAAGTVTVFDSGGFAGTAQLADLVPNDSRLLQYAVDLDVSLLRTSTAAAERVVAVRFSGGFVQTTVATRRTTTVKVKTTSSDPRFLVVELPRVAGFDVVSPTPQPALTKDAYRFGVALNGGEDPELPTQLRCGTGDDCTLEVVLERTDLRTTALAQVSVDTLAFYLENVELSSADRDIIDQVVKLQREADAKGRDLRAATTEIDSIHSEQDRIRQNMAALDKSSALYRRYVNDLTNQEDRLVELLDRQSDLRSEIARLQGQVSDLIAKLGG